MDGGSEKEKKRVRLQFGLDSFESVIPDLDSPESKRLRLESDVGTLDVKRIQDDLLDMLDDSDDGAADRDTAIQSLDSVIRSFEEEILVPEGSPAAPDLALDVVRGQTELGYLLEASDDELGLPPNFGTSEDDRNCDAADPPVEFPGAFEFNNSLGLVNELPEYDCFGFGMCGVPDVGSDNHDKEQLVSLGRLFDNSGDSYDGGDDAPEYLWRQESLPAM
ncbi:hypothetical protein SAY87_026180 [Trapa incisa]|uniref:Uncharacterized protein n=1 Tax=Trapa incisa TaxID=236973 RepID=A0AAN7JKW6_9MYRT|nr:hypothetical protein SAY87_026180 [Trapa incisa]